MVKGQYDALIIGSGMGGMSSAALLSHAGYRILVVEKLPRIGGRCSTIEYKGVKCTTGVIGPEMGGVVEELFREVGAEFDVRPAGPPHYLIKGKILKMPLKGGLRTLLASATNDSSEVERVSEALSKALRWSEPSKTISLRDWLLQYTQNEAILGIFQTMVSAAMLVNIDELPAQEYFLFIKKLGGYREFGFCPHGSISLPEALMKVVQQRGGELWTHSQAKRILLENGSVCGAIIEKDEKEVEVKASVVVSNVGPKKTVELAGRENMDQGYLRELEAMIRPAMIICIQMVSDRPLLDQNYLLVTQARRVNAIFQPTRVCPELAPPGKDFLLVGAAPASSLPPLHADKEIELCMEDLKELFPRFDQHSEILLVSTFHGDWPGFHSWPGYSIGHKTPIVNLYNAGDGVSPSGTVALPSTVLSARLVVEDVKNRIRPTA
jgi:phytoene dehydrogenase-like protein